MVLRENGVDAKPRVLMVSSNGSGVGHLTRLAAIEDHLDAQVLTYTMSGAHYRLGKPQGTVVHFPSYGDLGMYGRVWNVLLDAHFDAIVQGFRPSLVVFDGTSVYAGVRKVATRRNVPLIWVQRGCWKPEVDKKSPHRRNAGEFASEVIIPRDYGCKETVDIAGLEPKYVAPIVREPDEVLGREEARKALGLPLDKKLFLIQLGGGTIGTVTNVRAKALETIAEIGPEWAPVLSRHPLNKEAAVPGVPEVSAYPLSKYFAAFDALICPAGYNSVQESVHFALPAVLIPNQATITDDQARRAHEMASAGLALEAETEGEVMQAIREICGDNARARIKEKALNTRETDGAYEAAQFIRGLL